MQANEEIFKQSLEKRLTHQYVGEFQHLDQWETIGVVHGLCSSTLEHNADDENGVDPCDPQTSVMLVLVDSIPKGKRTLKEIENALRDTFSNSGCACVHDCCGCVSSHASAEYLGNRHWKVIIHRSKNY